MIQPIDISIDQIRNDGRYRFTTPSERPDLARSIRESGIRNPIQVLQTPEGWIPFSGFSRLAAARELGFLSIPVETLDSSQELIRFFRLVLVEHRAVRPLNLVEKSRIVVILDRMDPEWIKTHSDIASILEAPSAKRDVLRNIASCPDVMIRYIETFGPSLKQVESLLRFDPDILEAATRFAFASSVRAVELLEILDWVEGISRQEGITIRRVLDESAAVPEKTEENRNQRFARIKANLFARRFLTVTAFNEKLSSERTTLHFPDFARLTWDPTLEQPGVKLDGFIRSNADLDKLSRFFSDPKNIERFKRLIDW